MSDLNIALVLKLVDRATAPARAAMNNVLGMGKRTADEQRASMRRAAVMTVGAGAAITALVKPAIAFEDAMVGVSKVVEFQQENGLEKMGRDIQLLSMNTPMAAEGIAEIVAAAGRMGVVAQNLPDEEKRQQLLGFADAANKMAVAFEIGPEQAALSMAIWRNNLDLTQKDVLVLGDAINLLGNSMATTETNIAKVVTENGAIGRAAGMASEEIVALSATILASGASPERAGTGMKNFLNALTKGTSATKRQTAVLDELGLSSVDLAKRMQGDAKGAILEVLEALSQLDKYKQNSAVGDLFGEESKAAIMPLLINTDLLSEAFTKVADRTVAAGGMQEEYERQISATSGQLKIMTGSFTVLASILGTEILPIINDVVSAIIPVVQATATWAGQNPILVKGLLAVAGALTALRIAALANPVVALLTLLIGGAMAIYENWDGIVAWFTDIMDKVAAVFDIDFFAIGANMIQSLWDGIGSLLEQMVSYVSAKLEAIVPPWLISAWTWASSVNSNATYDPNAAITSPSMGQTLGGGNTALSSDTQSYLNNLPQRALGGPVRAGMLYEINERGQEFFSPDQDGHVIPAGKIKAGLARAGNSLRIGDINIHAAPGMNPMDIARAVRREIERMADAAGSALHDGGAYAD